MTDAHGRFELRGLAVGSHRLFSASSEWFLKPSQPAVGSTVVVLTALPALSIGGVVLDARSKEPVEATVFLGRWKLTKGPGDLTTMSEFTEVPVVTHNGRFVFIRAAPAADDDTHTSVRAVPVSQDFTESPRLEPLERGERHAEVELLVERLGSGTLVLEATSPTGAPFDGRLRAVLLPRGWTGGQREPGAVMERAGRYRIAVPAGRDWEVHLSTVPPDTMEGSMSGGSLRAPVRVRDGGLAELQAVFPRYGRLRMKWPADGSTVLLKSLEKEGSTMNNRMSPGTPMPEAGIRVSVPEGRYQVLLMNDGKGSPPRDVEVKANEETVVDLR